MINNSGALVFKCWVRCWGMPGHFHVDTAALPLEFPFPWEPGVMQTNNAQFWKLGWASEPTRAGDCVGSQFLWDFLLWSVQSLSWTWPPGLQVGFPEASIQTSPSPGCALGGKWSVQVFMSVPRLFQSFTPVFGRFGPGFPVRLHCQELYVQQTLWAAGKDENYPLGFFRASASTSNLLRQVSSLRASEKDILLPKLPGGLLLGQLFPIKAFLCIQIQHRGIFQLQDSILASHSSRGSKIHNIFIKCP